MDWDKSGRALRVGIGGYFYDKPTYQRPVEEITSALDSLKTISASVKPQLDLIKTANTAAAKSIVRVEVSDSPNIFGCRAAGQERLMMEAQSKRSNVHLIIRLRKCSPCKHADILLLSQKASKRKRGCEKQLWRKEAALRKLQQKAQSGKDPNAAQKVKAAEDDVQLARNNLHIAEAELSREMQHTMNGTAPEAAMQVARALEAMILFLVGSGIDVSAIRAAIRMLEETQYISPLTAQGSQQQMLMQSLTGKKEHSVNTFNSASAADLARHPSQSSRPASPTDPGSQQVTPRPAGSGPASPRSSREEARLSASPTNPFASD
ncbi:hypothetical protein ACSSS7_002632 [Eimeria intestinalis]